MASPHAHRPLLLVVDDDARSAHLLARLLSAEGYDVEVTTDGATALGRLTRRPVPDALISDYHMPHADGLAVGRYARSRRSAIPIFIITGYPDAALQALKDETLPDPVVVVLTKPLEYTDFLVRLNAAVPLVKAL